MKKEHIEKLTLAEKTVIGYCLEGNIHEAINLGLKPEMFTEKAYHSIFSAMIKVFLEGKEPTIELIASKIENLSEYSLKMAECMEVKTTQNTKWAVKAIVNAYHLRNDLQRVRDVYNDGLHADPMEGYPLAEKLLALVDCKSENDGKTYGSSEDLVVETLAAIEKDIEEGGMKGVKTGIGKLDACLGGGLKPNRLYTIAARTGCGKTAMATNICYNAGKEGYVPLYLTIELNHKEVTERMLCYTGKINTENLASRNLSPDDMDRLAHASKLVNDINYFVSPYTGGDWDKAKMVMRFYTRYRGVNLIIIDYIQQFHIRSKNLTSREELTIMTGELKAFAMETGCSILMIAQMNRDVEKRKEKNPLLSDLKDSGSIEQDSDVVIMLTLDEDKNAMREPVEIINAYVAKNRQGRVGFTQINVDLSTNTICGE